MIDLGTVRPGTTLNIPFSTFDSNDPSASVTVTALVAGDIEIYKDGSLTQRASDAGYVVDVDLDTTVGVHSLQIDLADNTTAGFFSAGSEYVVVVGPMTVDAATINFVAARFTIGYPAAILNTTIFSTGSPTSLVLTSGPAEADVFNGMWCIIHDVASAVQIGQAIITDYAVTTKTVTLAAATSFTIAATDNISIMGPSPDAALDTAIVELGVAAPTATPTVRTALMLLYMALRNKTIVQTSGTDALEIHNDAGTKIASKLLTDDGSDYNEAQMS